MIHGILLGRCLNSVLYAFLTIREMMQISPARAFAAAFAKHLE